MTLRICLLDMVCVLLVSPVAFGTIENVGYWQGFGGATGDPCHTGAYAYANGSTTNDYEGASGSQRTYTTEEGWFTWGYYLYAWAGLDLFLWSNEDCAARAQGYAEASCPNGYGMTPEAYIECVDKGVWGEHVAMSDYEEVNGFYWSDDDYFEADEGVDAYHSAFCQAVVQEGRSDVAQSHACVWAWTFMHHDE